MSKIVKVEVPDIGDFTNVDIIEVLVTPGDQIAAEDALITLESDKATIEIPSPQAGTVKEVLVKVNDKVSQGDVILTMELSAAEAPSTEADEEKTVPAAESTASEPTPAPAAKTAPAGDSDMHAEVVVLGSGPGG
jgi:dihydrolipoamide dehydrogenase